MPATTDHPDLSPTRLAAHAYAIDAAGWTVVRDHLTPSVLGTIRADADRALAATRQAIAAGRAGGHTVVDASYTVARRFYRWSETAFAMLEHPAVHLLGERLLRSYHVRSHRPSIAPHPRGSRQRHGMASRFRQ